LRGHVACRDRPRLRADRPRALPLPHARPAQEEEDARRLAQNLADNELAQHLHEQEQQAPGSPGADVAGAGKGSGAALLSAAALDALDSERYALEAFGEQWQQAEPAAPAAPLSAALQAQLKELEAAFGQQAGSDLLRETLLSVGGDMGRARMALLDMGIAQAPAPPQPPAAAGPQQARTLAAKQLGLRAPILAPAPPRAGFSLSKRGSGGYGVGGSNAPPSAREVLLECEKRQAIFRKHMDS
jgi:hypothetical protein